MKPFTDAKLEPRVAALERTKRGLVLDNAELNGDVAELRRLINETNEQLLLQKHRLDNAFKRINETGRDMEHALGVLERHSPLIDGLADRLDRYFERLGALEGQVNQLQNLVQGMIQNQNTCSVLHKDVHTFESEWAEVQDQEGNVIARWRYASPADLGVTLQAAAEEAAAYLRSVIQYDERPEVVIAAAKAVLELAGARVRPE